MRSASQAHGEISMQLAGLLGTAPTHSRQIPWHSASFSGARHVFHFACRGDGAGLCNHDFAIDGHIVADIVTAAGELGGMIVEVLSVAET